MTLEKILYTAKAHRNALANRQEPETMTISALVLAVVSRIVR